MVENGLESVRMVKHVLVRMGQNRMVQNGPLSLFPPSSLPPSPNNPFRSAGAEEGTDPREAPRGHHCLFGRLDLGVDRGRSRLDRNRNRPGRGALSKEYPRLPNTHLFFVCLFFLLCFCLLPGRF